MARPDLMAQMVVGAPVVRGKTGRSICLGHAETVGCWRKEILTLVMPPVLVPCCLCAPGVAAGGFVNVLAANSPGLGRVPSLHGADEWCACETRRWALLLQRLLGRIWPVKVDMGS